jgi:hypothetical protein
MDSSIAISKRNKGFNGYQIKLFMAILMVFDHLHYIPNILDSNTAGILHVLTRVVGAWFAFMAVEGFVHTSNRFKYNLRLFMWALFMLAGNMLLKLSWSIDIQNNIFMTLAVGVLILNITQVKYYKKNTVTKIAFWVLIIPIFIVGCFVTEGGISLIPFMLITYFFRENNSLRNSFYILFAMFLFAISYSSYENIYLTIKMLMYNSDFMFILVLPFMRMYNGLRGPKTFFAKYFFYVFYPAHLWTIVIIGEFCN